MNLRAAGTKAGARGLRPCYRRGQFYEKPTEYGLNSREGHRDLEVHSERKEDAGRQQEREAPRQCQLHQPPQETPQAPQVEERPNGDQEVEVSTQVEAREPRRTQAIIGTSVKNGSKAVTMRPTYNHSKEGLGGKVGEKIKVRFRAVLYECINKIKYQSDRVERLTSGKS